MSDYGVRLEVWGSAACFTRPELKAERFSYAVMTPSAARGILEAVFWHPGLRWAIDRIHVLSPIQFANVRRNEFTSKISARNVSDLAGKKGEEIYQSAKEDIKLRAQRAATILRHPHYIIEAHFEMTEKANASDNPGKFREMFCRRARKGQCYHTPYLGCREFPAHFRLYEEALPAQEGETKDLGFMLYDMDYTDQQNIQPTFFQAQLVNGVLELSDCEVYR
ncbi:MAG: type I-C CRISPR-associated protein Cas5c [Schwartzia sp. (in: firmicutes)]